MSYWGGRWRNVVDLHHIPAGTHSLAPRPGPLVRLTFRASLDFRFQISDFRFAAGARGRSCTGTVQGLGLPPLPWATRATPCWIPNLKFQISNSLKAGALGQTRTDTGRGLSPPPLLVGLRERRDFRSVIFDLRFGGRLRLRTTTPRAAARKQPLRITDYWQLATDN